MPINPFYSNSTRQFVAVAAGCLALSGTVLGFAGECDPEWSALATPSGNGVSNIVRDLIAFDDGAGESLYVAGQFSTAGGTAANGIARWDGAAWASLTGPDGNGVDGSVLALTVFDDGSGPALYAAGGFSSAGGVTANNIARWDGTAWSPLVGPGGNGVDGLVWALTVFDDGNGPALYAGGDFTTAGGEVVNRVARWDGNDWSPLPGASATGVDARVTAFSVFDDGNGADLYAGGFFTFAGGTRVNHIGRWDGTTWSPLVAPSGSGVTDAVNAFAVFDDGTGPGLYAGGTFTDVLGFPTSFIARWDGADWSPLNNASGDGLSDFVFALEVFDDGSGPALYAGGNIVPFDGLMTNRIARWSGTAWSALTGPAETGLLGDSVWAMTTFEDETGPALAVGGVFLSAGGIEASNIARWGSPCASAPCPPDVTNDNTINLADLNLVLANFGTTTPDGDTNNDGVVDLSDLNAVLGAFGTDCP